ncbi:hypothetical protein GCM10018980_16730 [Streptomyces capoamus]|uniref:Uncharacterized protein n=1 Tax=Streptomyces capoamus TaxID=68183 RepID=A0A919C1H9_9ACTN|nr:hypothetical protein GCM10010501_17810 [Streptomyces libani subsp. rufus]GHG41512.1 hypothetical protein GCM10018980_16730 [Streptomyces capoamus]
MDALRVYVRIAALLRVPPTEGLAERVRTAYFERPGNRWSLLMGLVENPHLALRGGTDLLCLIPTA